MKPICPDCGGGLKLEDMAEVWERPQSVFKCQGFCKTWVYRPEWVDEETGESEAPQTVIIQLPLF